MNIAKVHMKLLPLYYIRDYGPQKCGRCLWGLNKNTMKTKILQYWLRHAPKNHKKIEVIFPIPGYSFIPADLLSAQIEKKLKKIVTLVDLTAHESI